MLKKILGTIEAHSLIKNGDSVLAALSGGADSVCLTHALCSLREKLGITVYAAHVNHGIRGEEALRDESFSKRFCAELGIECYTLHADIPKMAKETGVSEETAGRQARYGFFDEICRQHGIDKIATAHNKNDSAETILMNFIRGSSTGGLGGIPYRRGNIIRPILDLSRGEIELYCGKNGLEYMTDSTNAETVYTRNKIRHILIPLIERELNSGFTETVCANASLIREDGEYLDRLAHDAYIKIVKNGAADVKELLALDIALGRRVIREMIKDARKTLEDASSSHVADAMSLLYKNSGASVNLSGGITAKTEYGRLIIERAKQPAAPFCYTFRQNSSGSIEEIGASVTITAADRRKKDGAVYISCGDSDKITIRSRREGDVFFPCGMNGSKKVKEYFINKKIPRDERSRVPIIEINGEIAAVGDRVDRRFIFAENGLRIEIKPI